VPCDGRPHRVAVHLAEAAALGLKLVRHDQPVSLAIAKADRLKLFQRCVDVYE